MPEVLEIETKSFEFPWEEDDFIQCLRRRDIIGMVAEYDDEVIGFFIYELHKNQLHVIDFAVRPDVVRSGIGRQMAQKLIGKLSQQHRNKITLEIRESNLAAQLCRPKHQKNPNWKNGGITRGKSRKAWNTSK